METKDIANKIVEEIIWLDCEDIGRFVPAFPGQVADRIKKALDLERKRTKGWEIIFDAMRAKEQPYIELWQKETGKTGFPDRGEFIAWLIDEIESLKEQELYLTKMVYLEK